MKKSIKKTIGAVLTAALITASFSTAALAETSYSYKISVKVSGNVLNAVVSATTEKKDVNCYIAEYNESGELISISKNSDIHSGENNFEQTLNKGTSEVNVFLWDEMKPITKKLTISLAED